MNNRGRKTTAAPKKRQSPTQSGSKVFHAHSRHRSQFVMPRTAMRYGSHHMAGTNDNSKREMRLQVQPLALTVSANPVTITMRAYYSSYHLWAAKHFCELAKNAENEPGDHTRFDIKHRAYVTNSILSAVAFLEAAINELYQDAADNHESYITKLNADSKQLMSDFWQFTEERNRSAFNLLDKYQIALTFLRKPQFDSGQSPYQDVTLVVRLRNELVHFKPKSLGGDVEHKLARQLRGKFAENKLMDGSGNPWFPDKCLGHGCAQWAVASVTNFADQFFAAIDVEPNYQRIEFDPVPEEA